MGQYHLRAGMTGTMPWSSSAPTTLSNDPSEMLQRIERNTASTLSWVKIVFAVVILFGVLIAVGF
ncbi:MAG TPA: hypothetical protein VJ021_04505 [Thermoplasmata archaeon]|nr:hypothetical protein [Thermoplasmata archaeon]